MADKRASLWNHEHREHYLEASKAAAEQHSARRDGVDTARDLPRLWNELAPAERTLMACLLLTGSPTIVALHDDGLLDGLIAKGLLQKPAGVGTLFMNSYETTYDVPRAVWESLNDNVHNFLPDPDSDRERRHHETIRCLRERGLIFGGHSNPEGSATLA